ncbi:MAG: hypothetical protein B7C24_11990 [Bacteroidetes bacterium 4572_77]|nr:MAG: hypothetical protein B7C24_11990 [Bacteroidetes bacterium 4572_77]
MFIAVTIANGLILKYRSKKYIAQNPELEEGYDKYFKGWMIYGNIPWIIMMIGNLSGTTQNTFEYFNPKALNPMVLVFHFSIIILWILSARWIYFKNGAEFIENHPGLLQKSSFSGNTNVTAKQIKLFFPLLLLGGIVGMGMMWFMDFPTPHF